MSNRSMHQLLVDLNTEEITRLIPLIIFLILIVIMGLPGNFLVCLVYRKSYKESNSKYFILCLAVSDFLSCFVVTLEIVNVIGQYTYKNEWLCKMTIFLEIWPVMTSGGLLCVISVDRYRKVCHPFGWQITHNAARISCVGMGFLALMCAWPALIVFGIKEVKTHAQNVTGTECGILTKYLETTPSKIYNGVLWLIFVTSLSVLSVLYCLIVRKLINQPKKTHSVIKNNPELSKQSDQNLVEVESASSSSVFHQGLKTIKSSASSSNIRRDSCKSMANSIRRSKSASQARTMKSAYIMCLVSIVFIFSFLPYLILRLLEALDPAFVESLSNAGRAAYKTVLRCYFLNCAINPVIYCACSSYFRKDLLKMIRRACYRLCHH